MRKKSLKVQRNWSVEVEIGDEKCCSQRCRAKKRKGFLKRFRFNQLRPIFRVELWIKHKVKWRLWADEQNFSPWSEVVKNQQPKREEKKLVPFDTSEDIFHFGRTFLHFSTNFRVSCEKKSAVLAISRTALLYYLHFLDIHDFPSLLLQS